MSFNNILGFGQILFYIVPIMIILTMGLTLAMLFSTKFRGKMMSRQVKAMKHMTDYSKEDMEDIMSDLGDVAIHAQNNIINENEDILKNISKKQAEINKEAIKTTANAIKEGLNENDTMFCKHCGALIDADSQFCKVCGKKL